MTPTPEQEAIIAFAKCDKSKVLIPLTQGLFTLVDAEDYEASIINFEEMVCPSK